MMKNMMRMVENREEQLLHKDLYSLGARKNYWKGSPWRAVKEMFQSESRH